MPTDPKLYIYDPKLYIYIKAYKGMIYEHLSKKNDKG